jgi:hypothetical protein
MRLFIGKFGCYRVTALQERRKAGWRVRTWSNGEGGLAHDYWVENGQFYAIRIEMPYSVEEQSNMGENGDTPVPGAEREAVLKMIAKWEAEGLDRRSPSDNGQEAFQAAA